MANTFRFSGRHIPIQTASGAIASGAFCVQEGFFGVAIKAMATGDSGQLDVEGVHLLDVPAGVLKGDLLYVAGNTRPLADATAPSLTETSSGNTAVGIAVGDRGSDGKALVKLLPQA